ncbi:MAG TPA: ABC transporter permease subunit, partial [Planctomycetota bacterium]|nr:ABC transporter permease subunit [Planctomycetota bacterium]
GASVRCVSDRGRGALALGLSDGRAIPLDLRFDLTYSEGEGVRRITPAVSPRDPLKVDESGRPLRFLSHIVTEKGAAYAAAVDAREIALLLLKRKKSLIGEGKPEETRRKVAIPGAGEVRALALDGRGDDLFVGTSAGALFRVDLRDPAEPRIAETLSPATRNGAPVTLLGFLIGDRTLVVGDGAGGVASWQLLRPAESDYRLSRIYDFESHASPIVAFSPSMRDKGFLVADEGGTLRLNYGTTGSTLLTLETGRAGVRAVALAPRGNGAIALDGSGAAGSWAIHNPHPEATLKSIFGKITYEGYDKPEHVWQSTGGTDDFEAKLGLTPLLIGTLKGTVYALLIAVPLALLSALYVSQFMHPQIKGYVKPVVEVMAALPSVVLGFIAGLWLAPRVEKSAPGLFLMPLVTAGFVLAALLGWRRMPIRIRSRLKHGMEIALLIPVVLLAAWFSLQLGAWMESAILAGDYRGWLRRAFEVTYEQRNSIVVGFAMGFAVIPIIFTIAEDSLSNVPSHLTAGSLALGATRWQTALRVVLPTGSPGIFSAIMIGFGRAVGETMIVLMATGNTPILNFSPFNGFRALSANVAVELPDAAVGGTHFRVLFLAAFLLFVMTFLVNTLAEVVRLRLRKRYQYL